MVQSTQRPRPFAGSHCAAVCSFSSGTVNHTHSRLAASSAVVTTNTQRMPSPAAMPPPLSGPSELPRNVADAVMPKIVPRVSRDTLRFLKAIKRALQMIAAESMEKKGTLYKIYDIKDEEKIIVMAGFSNSEQDEFNRSGVVSAMLGASLAMRITSAKGRGPG